MQHIFCIVHASLHVKCKLHWSGLNIFTNLRCQKVLHYLLYKDYIEIHMICLAMIFICILGLKEDQLG
jgi:hypothetical protein